MLIETNYGKDFKSELGEFLDYEQSHKQDSNIIKFQSYPTELVQQDWIKKCLEAIRLFMGEENLAKFNLQLNYDKNQNRQSVTLPIEFIPGLCGISMDIFFDNQSILILSYLTKFDQTPYYASNKNIINMLTYVALKQNESLDLGAVCINPQTGLFTYKTYSQFSKIEQQTCDLSVLVSFFEKQYNNHLELMKKLAPKILYLMNKISLKQYNYCKENLNEGKQNDNKDGSILDQLKTIIHEKCIKQMNDSEENKYFEGIPQPKNLPILTQINIAKPTNNQPTQKQQGVQQQDSEMLLNDWKTQTPLASGGYSEIRKVQITYKSGDVLQKRFLAVKTDQVEKVTAENEKKKKNNQQIEQECNDHKVNHELMILKHLAQQPGPTKRGEGFIATSYFDPSIQGCYFMEFYNNGSLDQYASSKNIVLSLRTKLFILAGIIQGVEFMHKKGVAHLDLKLGNVLIQKQLMPKICDFGEAQFINKIKKDKQDYSYTIPFSAPELFNTEEITEAYDIFSFGVIMCSLIFEQYPFEFNPSEPSSLEERFRKNTYSIKRNLPNQIKQGPKKIMKYIVKLIFLCLQSKAEVRPKPGWLVVAIWKMINYIDSF